ncbi:MAG: phosphorybosylanthranilate isomerase [Thermoprotei archaeon]|nr:MAG: phosphorybosylanthranilate isomerase [Thermoprotei archaeon]
MRLEELFRVSKPIIGVVHLKPLPGSPRYQGSMSEVLERAISDAKALEEGGVDGVIVENYGDAPYFPGRVGPETVASMAVVVKEVVKRLNIPVGVNVLRSDGEAALAIATACGASFIRVNVYTGVYVTDQGLIEGRSHAIMRAKALLRADVKVLADVAVKHAASLAQRSAVDEALDAVERGLADAVIVTGSRTGQPPSLDELVELKRALRGTLVFVGSGVNEENVEKLLEAADGAIVGTYFKRGGITENEVDVDRVTKLMSRVKELRGR